MSYRIDNLTPDDLIALLVALRTSSMPPPPWLDAPPDVRQKMQDFSVTEKFVKCEFFCGNGVCGIRCEF